MAYTYTAANVIAQSGGTILQGISGSTITQGMAVYRSTVDGKYKSASTNSTANVAEGVGIALTASSNGQPIVILAHGQIDYGSGVFDVGAPIFLGSSDGGLFGPAAVIGDAYTTFVGFALSASLLRLNFDPAGVFYVAP